MDNRRFYTKSDLEILEEKASLALVQLLDAIDKGVDREYIEFLQNKCDSTQRQLEEAQNSSFIQNKSTTNIISSKLSQLPVQIKSPSVAQPIRVFTPEEGLRINKHYETLPLHLKALLDASLDDSNITMEKITNPVFLKGEGYVYDLSTVEDMLKDKDAANYPRNTSKQFTRKDIIPCNALVTAMLQIFNILEGRVTHAQPVEINPYMTQEPQNNHASISLEMIKMVEDFYFKGIEDKHKILFDTICRDSSTNMIVQNPVFLPDGYIYDKKTVLFLLDSGQGRANCPKMSNIEFTEEDITPCPLAVAVLEQLKINIQNKLMAMQNSQNKENEPSRKYGMM